MSIQETRAKFGTFSLFYLQVLQSAGNLALGHFSFLVFTREAQNNNFNLPFFSVSLETLSSPLKKEGFSCFAIGTNLCCPS